MPSVEFYYKNFQNRAPSTKKWQIQQIHILGAPQSFPGQSFRRKKLAETLETQKHSKSSVSPQAEQITWAMNPTWKSESELQTTRTFLTWGII